MSCTSAGSLNTNSGSPFDGLGLSSFFSLVSSTGESPDLLMESFGVDEPFVCFGNGRRSDGPPEASKVTFLFFFDSGGLSSANLSVVETVGTVLPSFREAIVRRPFHFLLCSSFRSFLALRACCRKSLRETLWRLTFDPPKRLESWSGGDYPPHVHVAKKKYLDPPLIVPGITGWQNVWFS
ncbi:uncharacterized protein EI90DRAFT_2313675 [Cantharellus anzutake]|uniref:uncharacterized protein n=1 Tax=Cantharellus anzutake TaxID=1750568 RepID=UPI0019077224|nr:uncharacterized protein EI90DRAFT_2313675 [Cantharellus anzutake]KAF8339978.1 hypothetical protein EI90DRAFT_2313675 [Cantharellus anzutake]